MRIFMLILACITVLPYAMAGEDKQKTLQELQTEEFLLGGSIWERLQREVKQKEIQCIKAFPHEEFCTCLVDKIPMSFSMIHYVTVVTMSREELGYDQLSELSEDERKAVDVTIQARETCASKVN